jgi:hypothetical protein
MSNTLPADEHAAELVHERRGPGRFGFNAAGCNPASECGIALSPHLAERLTSARMALSSSVRSCAAFKRCETCRIHRLCPDARESDRYIVKRIYYTGVRIRAMAHPDRTTPGVSSATWLRRAAG